MTARTAADREQLREQAHQLIAEGLSNRAIGARLGVGKDTVRRWRTTDCATTHSGAPADAPPAAPDAPPLQAARATPPPDDAAAAAPAALHGARRLTLALDDDLDEDLALLAAAGLGSAAAVARAVQLYADAVRSAWDYDDAPRGTLPRICAHATGAPTLHCTPTTATATAAGVRRPTNGTS